MTHTTPRNNKTIVFALSVLCLFVSCLSIDAAESRTGLVLEMLFENTPLVDSSEAANSFVIRGTAQPLRQGTGVFDGNTWIEFARNNNALDCSNVAWHIDVEIIPDAPNGVIVSHGGERHGYSLFLQDGRPGFAVRILGRHYSILGSERIEGRTLLSASIAARREIVLQVNGEIVARRGIPFLIETIPTDPPIIGNDLDGTVFETRLPAFRGTMNRIAMYRGGWTPVEPHPQPKATIRRDNQPPNFVLIIADDLSFTDIGSYGSPNAITPRLDLLAAQGVRFTHCYTANATCVPLRNMLYTGLFPVRTGSYRNHTDCHPGTISIVHYLTQLGYRVGLSGKYHVGPRESFPFEDVPGLTTNCVIATDNYIFDYVREFMTRDASEPFFLVVGFVQPHVPWTVGDRSLFDPATLELPPHWADTPETRQSYVEYLAEVTFLDYQVGELIDIIDGAGLKDNTVVIFLSEQGAQFPGAKWTLWDQGVRTGAMLRWPGVVEPGRVSGALIEYTDFVPTILDIARRGQPPAPTEPFDLDNLDLDGSSFLAVLEGKTDEHGKYAFGIHNNIPEGPRYSIRSVRTKQFSYIRNYHHEEQYLIRFTHLDPNQPFYPSWRRAAEQGDERAIRAIQRDEWRPFEELYDMIADPWEMNNLIDSAEHQEILQELRDALDAWMKQQGDPGPSLDRPLGAPLET